MGDDVFRVTPRRQRLCLHANNQVLSKSEFDQRNAQSTTEMNALKNQKDDLDSEFDDMRAKIQTMKKPVKKAKGGSASSRADGCATKGKTKGRFV
jgi:predicted  nucleic acid-binding Zn-ribbon protein